jgi:Domain of unknown function (DUF3883)
LASRGAEKVLVEVKGLSGSNLCVELTPNEYRALNEHQMSYRLCVVTNALSGPVLDLFGYVANSDRWESANGRVLRIEERIAARCTA